MTLYDKQYLGIAKDILEEGFLGKNRTQFKAYKIPQRTMELNLEEEYPMLTSKEVPFEVLADEILWIWVRQSNCVDDLNSKIWDSWTDERRTIGKAYGYQLAPTERIFKVVKVPKRTNVNVETTVSYPLFEKREKTKSVDELIKGYINKNNNDLQFEIIDARKNTLTNEIFVDLQFEYTGYIAKDILLSEINKVEDIYYPSVQGRGFLGKQDYKNLNPKLESYLYNTWIYILRNKKKKLDARWLNFTQFVRDCRYLPNWSAKSKKPGEYVLDTNYYCSNVYSRETCVWLHKADYAFYQRCIPIKVENRITGSTAVELSMYTCVDKYNTNLEDIEKELLNKVPLDENTNAKKEGAYAFSFILDENEEYSYRYKLPVNQVNEIILKRLYDDKNSRRMVSSLWNVEELDEMNLEPCAYGTMWDVTDDKLNLSLIQRSGDFLLGVPFNTSQYALLCHMVAQVTGLKVGSLLHIINNAHIYENQVEGGIKQLSNPTYDAPKLWINPEVKDFYDFTVDDFKLIDYKNAGKIRMGEVAK